LTQASKNFSTMSASDWNSKVVTSEEFFPGVFASVNLSRTKFGFQLAFLLRHEAHGYRSCRIFSQKLPLEIGFADGSSKRKMSSVYESNRYKQITARYYSSFRFEPKARSTGTFVEDAPCTLLEGITRPPVENPFPPPPAPQLIAGASSARARDDALHRRRNWSPHDTAPPSRSIPPPASPDLTGTRVILLLLLLFTSRHSRVRRSTLSLFLYNILQYNICISVHREPLNVVWWWS